MYRNYSEIRAHNAESWAEMTACKYIRFETFPECTWVPIRAHLVLLFLNCDWLMTPVACRSSGCTLEAVNGVCGGAGGEAAASLLQLLVKSQTLIFLHDGVYAC